MDFDWDDEKNKANLRKHGLDLTDASRVFGPTLVVDLDDRFEYGEDRWAGLGMLDDRIV